MDVPVLLPVNEAPFPDEGDDRRGTFGGKIHPRLLKSLAILYRIQGSQNNKSQKLAWANIGVTKSLQTKYGVHFTYQ